MAEMRRAGIALIFIIVLSFGEFTQVSAGSNATGRLLTGFFSNAMSTLLRWLWSLPATTKPGFSSRQTIKFENGYTVETVFDGSKLGIDPFDVEVTANGELLLLDSSNSNIYKISSPLSLYSRPRLIGGSADGYPGHIDGKTRDARLNHPKGLTIDDRGNIYVADSLNMAIRKISETGVTTIAGGKGGRGGHVDGPSENAKFSNDFDVVYLGSSCSLLVIDRGHQAIREIQLHFEDCAYQYRSNFPLGIAVLIAAGFFGYMLALLQRQVTVMVSSDEDSKTPGKIVTPSSPYQKAPKRSLRVPLIPTEDEGIKQEENSSLSLGKIFENTCEFVLNFFPSFKRKSWKYQSNTWPMQESYVIPQEDEPPSLETRAPTPRKVYAFMTKDHEKISHSQQGRPNYNGWNGVNQTQSQYHHHQHQNRHYSSGSQTYYEQNCESTNEVVFGAVQEDDSKRNVEIRAVDYGDPMYNHHNIRHRINYLGYQYSDGYY